MKKLLYNKPLLTIISGLIIIVISKVSAYTTEVVGANIGAGILALVGLVLIAIGFAWLGFVSNGWTRIVILVCTLLFIISLSYLWQLNENELNRLYCKEKIEKQETIPEGPEFCLKYQ